MTASAFHGVFAAAIVKEPPIALTRGQLAGCRRRLACHVSPSVRVTWKGIRAPLDVSKFMAMVLPAVLLALAVRIRCIEGLIVISLAVHGDGSAARRTWRKDHSCLRRADERICADVTSAWRLAAQEDVAKLEAAVWVLPRLWRPAW
jgi:hypothetical protein